MRILLVGLVGVCALLVLPAASAKDFQPGDLSVCSRSHCVAIVDASALPQLDSFYYSDEAPARVHRPRLGAPYYELRFSNGYVTGIVATRRLDRFLSYGVNLGRFTRGQWYALPRGMSRELRQLTVSLRPRQLTRPALARSR